MVLILDTIIRLDFQLTDLRYPYWSSSRALSSVLSCAVFCPVLFRTCPRAGGRFRLDNTIRGQRIRVAFVLLIGLYSSVSFATFPTEMPHLLFSRCSVSRASLWLSAPQSSRNGQEAAYFPCLTERSSRRAVYLLPTPRYVARTRPRTYTRDLCSSDIVE